MKPPGLIIFSKDAHHGSSISLSQSTAVWHVLLKIHCILPSKGHAQ